MSTPLINNPVGRRFATTRWSLVLQARGQHTESARMALSELFAAYWLPLCAFIRHRSGNAHDAQDLTQEFFTQLLSKDYLNDVDPERGRFRSFLLASVKHYLSHERDRSATLKRGGGVVIESLDWQHGESCFQAGPADTMTAQPANEVCRSIA